MRFAAVSDHAEVFDDRRMEEYVQACAALSDRSFLVIPGLEFALKGGTIHILGYGIRRRVRFSTMEELVDGIHQAGGVAVLAHPPAGSINLIGSIKTKLDGIEVWNGRYDGTVAPRAGSFQLLRRIRALNPKAAAFCGIDLHQSSRHANWSTWKCSRIGSMQIRFSDQCRPAVSQSMAATRLFLRLEI